MKRIFTLLTLAFWLAYSSIAHAQDIGGDIEFEADHIVMTEADFQVLATGNVRLSNKDLKLNADRFLVSFLEPPEGSDELKLDYATAEGHVWGEAQGIEITAERARYDEGTQKAVFSGNAVVTQKGNAVSAQEVHINVATGVYELVGRVKGRITGSF